MPSKHAERRAAAGRTWQRRGVGGDIHDTTSTALIVRRDDGNVVIFPDPAMATRASSKATAISAEGNVWITVGV